MTPSELSDEVHARLATEAERLCDRYVREVVLAFGLCPWAHRSLEQSRVQISVITDEIDREGSFQPTAQAVASLLDELDPRVDLVLLALPLCRLNRLDMDGLLRVLRKEAPLLASRSEDAFAVAAFHPDARELRAQPEQLIPYIRRSPDPMLQFVRNRVLADLRDEASAGTSFLSITALDWTQTRERKSLRARVAEANSNSLQGAELAAFDHAVSDIIEDRRQSYARILDPRGKTTRDETGD